MYIFREEEHAQRVSLSLNEFIDGVESLGNKLDRDTLIENANLLLRLSYNHDFLLRYINEGLKNYEKFQTENNNNIQFLIFHSGKHFILRVNFWLAENIFAHDDVVNEFFSYGLIHDHNFDFLTVGYRGPGYHSDIYKYRNFDSGEYYVGKHVNVDYLGRITLKPHMVMLYENNVHIHSQLPPDEFSISINLMPKKKVNSDQYIFDSLSQKTLSIKRISLVSSKDSFLYEVTKRIGNDETFALLKKIR